MCAVKTEVNFQKFSTHHKKLTTMKADSAKQNQCPELETYKTTINGIEFWEKYIQDPDILSSNSSKVKHFLMQSFSHLHSDFHYLSFLNPEDLDMEIIKAARILQILPMTTSNKLSDLLENDFKKFWEKFFSLFKNKKQINFGRDSMCSSDWEDKITFFKDMKGALNYLNYALPVLNNKKLSASDINNEINNWHEVELQTATNKDKSVSFNFIEEEMTNIDVEKLVADLKQVISMYHNIKVVNKQNEPEHLNFFNNFIFCTKTIFEYKKDIGVINSMVLDDLNGQPILSDVNFLENLYFTKRCLKYMKTVKSK